MTAVWISVKERLPKNCAVTAADNEKVDVWMDVPASPLSFGIADAFRVPDAYRKNGKWFHRQGGKEMELNSAYITHWMCVPRPPKRTKGKK